MGLKDSLCLYAVTDIGGDQISEMKTGDIYTSSIIIALKIVMLQY